MTPESFDVTVPKKILPGKVVASAATPPLWQDSRIKYIPLIGNTLMLVMNVGRYVTTRAERKFHC